MITLIYASSATREMSKEALLEILKTAHENNPKLDITGMLLYKSGNFLQVLEGEEDKVTTLYDKIKKDQRHHHVMTVLQRPIKKREFDDWSMGFVNFGDINPNDLKGYNNFLNQSIEPEAFKDNPSFAKTFLMNFKEHMR